MISTRRQPIEETRTHEKRAHISRLPRRIASRANRASRGFTIIELLVVTAIIIVLLSLIIVAVNAASRAGQKANTQALMDSIKKSLIQFKEDIGYYPPVLGVPVPSAPINGNELRRLFPGSVPHPDAGNYVDAVQGYWSTCTLADYLIGYGGHNQDGYGKITGAPIAQDWDRETPPMGIRHPGDDAVWGASIPPGNGGLLWRMTGNGTGNPPLESSIAALDQGKVYGPYLELKDERLLAGVHYLPNGDLVTVFPGDPLPAPYTSFEQMPKAIVDYWGQPIRYYRRPYPAGAIGQSYRAVDRSNPPDGIVDRVPTLSDVFVLRQWEIKPGSETINEYADSSGNAASTSELDSAEFALLSSGPDKRVNEDVTIDVVPPDDDDEFNKDNIVEVGP